MQITATEIQLRQFQFYAYHGVLEQERKVGGQYTVDICLSLSAAVRAIENDELEGTVNYAEVYEVVKAEMMIPSALLEHVCGRILKALFSKFPLISRATVNVCKVNPPLGAAGNGCAVSVTAER